MKKRIMIVLLTMISIIVFLCFVPKTYRMVLKKEVCHGITLEYGKQISANPEDYLIFLKKSKKSKEKIISQTYIKVETIKGNSVSFQKTLPVGEYRIIVIYKEQIRKVSLKVVDTVPPSITGPDSLNIPIHSQIQNIDFSKYYLIQDLSELSIHYDIRNVQQDLSGQYKMTIYAKDCYENQSIKEVTVFIESSPLINQSSQESPRESFQETHYPLTNQKIIQPPKEFDRNDKYDEKNEVLHPSKQEPEINKDDQPTCYFWTKCKSCDTYYESQDTLQEVISSMEYHLDHHHECTGYTYGKSIR